MREVLVDIESREERVHKGRVGIYSLVASEAIFFGTLIVTYAVYVEGQRSLSGPTPRQVLDMPSAILSTVFLLSSSPTMALAGRAVRAGRSGRARSWLLLTCVLAAAFLGLEFSDWGHLLSHGLGVSRNLFGSAFFTLTGFHGAHVLVGILAMLTLVSLSLREDIATSFPVGFEMIEVYWHFVDSVWIAIFLVVYVFGR